MIDDRWTPPRSAPYARGSPSISLRERAALTDGERLLALEITNDHHEEMHRQTAHRLEMGDHRMDHIENRIDGASRELLELKQRDLARDMAQQTRAEEKASTRRSRNEAIQMAVWITALLGFLMTAWNFTHPRSPPSSQPSAITAPAPR